MAFQSKILCACGMLIVACFGSRAGAQLPVTQLRVLYPPAAQVGSTSTVEVLGQGPLDEIDRLIFSHPGLSANVMAGESDPLTNETRRQFGKFTLSIGSDVPAGFYEAWAVGRNGASSSRLFWVTPRPLAAAPQPAGDEQAVPQLTFDTIVIDRYAPAKIQRYDLALSAGQQVRVTALDAKLDSRALSHVRVLDPNAKLVTVASSKGIDGAVAAWTAEQTGDYRIELRDAVYRGGDEFFYAVWVETSEGPRVDATTAPWSERERVLASLTPGPGQVSEARRLSSLSIRRWLSADAPFVYAEASRTEALAVPAPCLVSGTFSSHAGGQSFDFAARKGDVYWVDVASEQVGERTDAHLSLFKLPATAPETAGGSSGDKANANVNVKPERLAEQDDPPAVGSAPFKITRSDPSLRFEAPADGNYRIVVRDQFASNATSAGGRFLLAIRKPQPSLALLAAWASPTNNAAQARPIGNHLLIDGAAAIRVVVQRIDGLSGPVEISCEGLPAGVTATPIIVPADRDEGHLILTSREPTAAFSGPIKIVGRLSSDAQIKAEAAAAELTWEPIPTWNALTHRLSEQLVVAVSDKDTIPITFEVGGPEPLVMARGGKLTLPIKVVRRDGGKDKAVLRAQGLPAKTTLADVTVDGAAGEAKAELAIAADAPLGEATFWFQVETKVKIRNNPQALQRAESHKAQLEKMLADPARATQKDAINAAIKAAAEEEKKLKELTAEREQAVFLPTHTVRIKIIDGPIEPATAWRIEAIRGSESDQPLAIKRLFGFDDAVDVQLVADPANKGIDLSPASIAKGAQETTCHLKLAADTPLGERKAQMKLSYKFNNQNLSIVLPLTVAVKE